MAEITTPIGAAASDFEARRLLRQTRPHFSHTDGDTFHVIWGNPVRGNRGPFQRLDQHA
jgi:hypothetical protein